MRDDDLAVHEMCAPPNSERHIGAEVRRISNLVHRMFGRYMGAEEADIISGTNGWILAYLAKNEDKEIFQRDLEEIFQVRRATVSKTIRLMEHKGLIEYSPVERDARLKKLTLTEKGRRLHEDKHAQIEKFERALVRDIPPEKLDTFYEVCDMIKQNIIRIKEED